MGSQNMIDSSYLKPANIKVGRHWKDPNIKVTGEIIMELEAVFAMDWYTETGGRLGLELELVDDSDADIVPMQLLPSGPGYLTIPNLRLFAGLVQRAQQKLSLTSPYFVPDDSLLEAISTAAYRGVAVELFVSEQADQFMVQHAQASY
jgi:cardiolipin synthase